MSASVSMTPQQPQTVYVQPQMSASVNANAYTQPVNAQVAQVRTSGLSTVQSARTSGRTLSTVTEDELAYEERRRKNKNKIWFGLLGSKIKDSVDASKGQEKQDRVDAKLQRKAEERRAKDALKAEKEESKRAERMAKAGRA